MKKAKIPLLPPGSTNDKLSTQKTGSGTAVGYDDDGPGTGEINLP